MISSTPEIVKALIDNGARLVARLADGRTALHLAAERGNVEMVRLIMQKSEENEEAETKKEDARKKSRMTARENKGDDTEMQPPDSDEEIGSDVEMIDANDPNSEDEVQTTTTGSYLKVKETDNNTDETILEENEDDPDVYDVNVLAWDLQCSPLHLAILNGHIEVVNELVQSFGADVLLPVKILNKHDKSPRGAILTLVLSLRLPLEKAKEMTMTLLKLGATCAQADTKQVTAFHYISNQQSAILDVLKENDEPAMNRSINHLGILGSQWRPQARSPLMSAIFKGDALSAMKLLEFGASPSIEFKDWLKSAESHFDHITKISTEQNHSTFMQDVEQPITLTVVNELPDITLLLLDMGADMNTLTASTSSNLNSGYSSYNMESLLDVVRKKITEIRVGLKRCKTMNKPTKPHMKLSHDVDYLENIELGSYKHYVTQVQLDRAKLSDKFGQDNYEQKMEEWNKRHESEEVLEQIKAFESLLKKFEELEQVLLDKGAKTFKELHPDIKTEERQRYNHGYSSKGENRPFQPNLGFSVHDLTDEARDAYMQL